MPDPDTDPMQLAQALADQFAELDAQGLAEQLARRTEPTGDAFWTWLQIGMSAGWVSEPLCATHDIIPSTEEGLEMWNNGFDPCEHVVRCWPDDQVAVWRRQQITCPEPTS